MSERQYSLRAPNHLNDPIVMVELDTSNGVMFPLYDADTNMVYLCGKVRILLIALCPIVYFSTSFCYFNAGRLGDPVLWNHGRTAVRALYQHLSNAGPAARHRYDAQERLRRYVLRDNPLFPTQQFWPVPSRLHDRAPKGEDELGGCRLVDFYFILVFSFSFPVRVVSRGFVPRYTRRCSCPVGRRMVRRKGRESDSGVDEVAPTVDQQARPQGSKEAQRAQQDASQKPVRIANGYFRRYRRRAAAAISPRLSTTEFRRSRKSFIILNVLILIAFIRKSFSLQPKVVEELMDEIRRLKSLLVKHEKRIRALEARAAAADGGITAAINPASTNSSMIEGNTTATSAGGENNHITHDTNANLAKQQSTTSAEDMAPDEVWIAPSQKRIENNTASLSCLNYSSSLHFTYDDLINIGQFIFHLPLPYFFSYTIFALWYLFSKNGTTRFHYTKAKQNRTTLFIPFPFLYILVINYLNAHSAFFFTQK